MFVDEKVNTPNVRLTVAAHLGRSGTHCGDRRKTLLMKEGASAEWVSLRGRIENFKWERGFEYVLEVVPAAPTKDGAPIDPMATQYTLVKEVSKTEKSREEVRQSRRQWKDARKVLKEQMGCKDEEEKHRHKHGRRGKGRGGSHRHRRHHHDEKEKK